MITWNFSSGTSLKELVLLRSSAAHSESHVGCWGATDDEEITFHARLAVEPPLTIEQVTSSAWGSQRKKARIFLCPGLVSSTSRNGDTWWWKIFGKTMARFS